jgi:phage baseplate assembly protein W
MDRHTGAPIDGIDEIAQSFGDILGTPIGTRIGRRTYGSELPELLDQPVNPVTILRVYAATAMALGRQEPRATLQRVQLARGDAAGSFVLQLQGVARLRDGRRQPFALSTPVRALSAIA